ncbi:tetratricopeptide repeat protein [Beggiatoa leptomitoformis]|uniref:Tetratricopeptide repeat protein n=1 Tax=Beggiatoa leptomitoformis TaxID=288004 RepID=A0A2N9YCN4_9GAMM|nr:tetratricopeptide repeat protein [Beggiatoa leptomitoformis]ALG66487.1 tetratricopeptide repeat protein [Beggiatoa leptomitoformis]AUI68222.1 tetratricopeptide repeat protein [Beggiatoa leptomitoformis]
MPQQVHVSPFIINPPAELYTPARRRVSADFALRYANRQKIEENELKAFGLDLWRALNIDEAFDTAYRQACPAILPIILESQDAQLQQLAWECLYHPQHGFLAKQPHFTLSRRVPTQCVVTPIQQRPLKVLLFTSLPENLTEQGRLNVENEQAHVLEALLEPVQRGIVQLEVPDDGRFQTLQQFLKQGFDVVFLSGHGVFHDEQHLTEKYGEFCFEDDNGNAVMVRDSELAKAFRGQGVQCVVLSACESGQSASADLSTGLAQSLVNIGLPHVVGMRESVLDIAGIAFARAFCEAIAQQARVDEAVQAGRQAIERGDTVGEDLKNHWRELSVTQWSLPILWSRDPAMPLVDWGFEVKPLADTVLSSSLSGLPPLQRFIGRRRELREWRNRLESRQVKQLLITGEGGQGKTALVTYLAQRLQQKGFIVHVYSARPENSWTEFETLLQFSLNEVHTPEFTAKQEKCKTAKLFAQLLISTLQKQTQRKLVLIFDNLESLQDLKTHALTDETITTWLSVIQQMGDSAPTVLLTSRWKLPNWQTGHLSLCHVNYGDFIQFIYLHNIPLPSEKEARFKLLRELYQAFQGNFRGLEFFLKLLPDLSQTDREQLLTSIKTAQTDLQTNQLLEKIIQTALEADERELLRRLTVYTTAVPQEGVKKIALSEPQLKPVEHLLQRLSHYSLIECIFNPPLQREIFYCGAMVRLWIQAHLPPITTTLYSQAADYQRYLFETDKKNYEQALAVHEALTLAGKKAEADNFALDELVPYFYRVGLYRTLLEWVEPMQGGEDKAIEGRVLNWLGTTNHALGNYETALRYLQQSLAIRQEIGDKRGEGMTLNNISGIYWSQGDYETALRYLQQSLAIQQEIGDKSGEGTTLNNISQIYDARGDYETALRYLQQSLAIRQEIGDKSGEGTTLNNISQIYSARGDTETALRYLQQSLAIAQEIGDKSGEGTTLNNMATTAYARGDYETALRYLQQSLAIQQEIGDVAGLCATLFNMGHIHLQNEEVQEGIAKFIEVYRIAHKIGEAQVLQALEQLAKDWGQDGLNYWEQVSQQMSEP